MKKIKTQAIIIPKSFLKTPPGQKKMDAVRSYVRENGKLDRPVVLAGKELVDNYVRYLVALEFGFDEIPYIPVSEYRKNEPDMIPTYIVGKFEGNDREYTWRVKKRMQVEVGDIVQVKSKCKDGSNTATVTVVKVFSSDDTKLLRHKPVIKKLKGASAKCQAAMTE